MITAPLKPVWTEGTFLTQQHCQQWDAYLHHQIHVRTALSDHHFGLRTFTSDDHTLKQNQFTCHACQWIVSTGQLVEVSEPLQCTLSPASGTQTVYLHLEDNQLIDTIPGYDAVTNAAFTLQFEHLADHYDKTRVAEVMCAQPKLKLSTFASSTGHSIAVARVQLNEAGVWQADPDFIPSCVHSAVSPVLQQQCHALYESLQFKCVQLKALLPSPTYAHLSVLGACMSKVAALLKYGVAWHPYRLYLLLIELASSFELYYTESHLSWPVYDHSDLSHTFKALFMSLQHAINTIETQNANQLRLIQQSNTIYSTSHIPLAVLQDYQWYLSLQSAKACAEWEEGVCNKIKVGSVSQIQTIVSCALPGVAITHCLHPPSNLHTKAGYSYFHINTTGYFWQDVIKDKSLALFIPEQLDVTQVELITLEQ